MTNLFSVNPSAGQREEEALAARGRLGAALSPKYLLRCLGKDGAGSWNPGRPAAVSAEEMHGAAAEPAVVWCESYGRGCCK